MGDPIGPLHEPEHEVVVLAAVKARSEAAQLDGQVATVHAQVAGVHDRRHVVRGPSGLDVAGERPIVGDHVLVAVEHVESGIGGDAARDVLEGVRGERVVVVQQRDVLASGERQGGVGGRGDAVGGVVAGEVDAGVSGGVALLARR